MLDIDRAGTSGGCPAQDGGTCVRGRRSRVPLQLFASERTEPATPRRRQEARKKGQVAKTGELSAALVLIAGFATLYLSAGYIAREVTRFSRYVYADLLRDYSRITLGEMSELFAKMILVAVRILWPLLAAVVVVGFASQAVQTGFLFATEPLKPQLRRLNPVSGFKKIFSKRALVELVKAALKITLVGTVAYAVVRPRIPAFVGFAEIETNEAVVIAGRAVFQVGIWVGLVMCLIALADYLYQRWEFETSIRMSKQEVREELRQTEGDPQIRAKIRQRQRQLAGMRMMAQVPMADVVITNPLHLAVALKYDAESMEAPTVVAKGAGKLAERIKEKAREHGVAVVENVWLARALYETAELGRAIPEDLYQAVAEVLAFVYRLKRGGVAGP